MATPVTRVQQPTRCPGRRLGARCFSPPRRLPAAPCDRRPAGAYGLWVLESVTENDVRRRSRLLRLPADHLRRRRRGAPGGGGARRSELLPARALAPLRPVARAARGGVRARRGGARLEALDPDRLLQLPAVRAREDRAHHRARGLRGGAPATNQRMGDDPGDHRYRGAAHGSRLQGAGLRDDADLRGRRARARCSSAEPRGGTWRCSRCSPPWSPARFSGSFPRPGSKCSSPTSASASWGSSIPTSTRAARPTTSTSRSRPSAPAVSTAAARPRDADQVQLPPRALDGLHLLVARGAARLCRGGDPAPALRGHHLARRPRSSPWRRTCYSAILAGTVVFALLIQLFINVGMTIGIAPVTGIPLPLVSYGGSSLLTTLFLIGMLEAVHIRGRLAGPR